MSETAKPVRVQLSRKKGWRMPPNTVKVDRSTKWGNPFGDTQPYLALPNPDPRQEYPKKLLKLRSPASIDRCLDMFAAHCCSLFITQGPDYFEPLRGKDLACWCPLDEPCHADILLEVANR